MPTYRVHFTKAKPGTSEIDVTADAVRIAGNYMFLDGPNGPKFVADAANVIYIERLDAVDAVAGLAQAGPTT